MSTIILNLILVLASNNQRLVRSGNFRFNLAKRFFLSFRCSDSFLTKSALALIDSPCILTLSLRNFLTNNKIFWQFIVYTNPIIHY